MGMQHSTLTLTLIYWAGIKSKLEYKPQYKMQLLCYQFSHYCSKYMETSMSATSPYCQPGKKENKICYVFSFIKFKCIIYASLHGK